MFDMEKIALCEVSGEDISFSISVDSLMMYKQNAANLKVSSK